MKREGHVNLFSQANLRPQKSFITFPVWTYKTYFYSKIKCEFQRSFNSDARETFEWGHPLDKFSRAWYHCPTIDTTLIENLEQLECKKSTCALRCEGGFLPVGRRRVKCRFNKKSGTYEWKRALGICKGCAETSPDPGMFIFDFNHY